MLIRRSVVQTLAAPVCQSTFRQDAEPQVIPDVSIGVQVLDRKYFSIEKKCLCVCEHTPPCI